MDMVAKFLYLFTALTITPCLSEARRLEIPSRLEVAEGDIVYLNDTLIQDTEHIAQIAIDVDDMRTVLDSLTTNVASITEQLSALNARAELASTVNLALYKPTLSSSEWDANYGPRKAVDGSPSLNGHELVCFASGQYDQYPWWEVDLQGTYAVSEVHVIARGEAGGAPERLREITITVSDWSQDVSGKMCGVNNAVATLGENLITACADKPTGRYVRIETVKRDYPSSDPFQFCEVKIFS